LGDIVFVELPEVGSQITLGSAFGVVESIKSVSDLYAPVSGKVTEVNKEAEASPELINENCYQTWLIKVEVESETEFQSMLDHDQYATFCQQN
jgi:glycine cleavage system H protein